MGRKDRNARRSDRASRPLPRLGRRKALWRFVGAMALTPFTGAAFGQGMAVPPAYVPGAYPPGAYAPQGNAPQGYAPAGYPGSVQGYVTPAGGAMVAPPPTASVSGPTGLASLSVPSGSMFTPRLVTSGGYGEGLGWDDGYQSIGAWIPLGINDSSQVFYTDLRGFQSFTDGGGGGNFTLGYRYYVPGMDRFFGAYAAYDIDAGNDQSDDFSQVVIGGESVGQYLQYRVNGYIPVGDTSSHVGTDPNFFFRQNNILFNTFTRYQYGGIDGEVGGPLPLVGKYGFSGYVGGYWLESDYDDTVGFKGRLEANVNDDLQIGGKLTTDDVFDTNVWVTMTLRSPRGSWADFFQRDWLRQPSVGIKSDRVGTWMDRSPEREYRVATRVQKNDVKAINPLTGLPYLVLHVDPNGDGGVGTFEDPTSAIQGPNNPGYDIIYVQPGTVTTGGPIRLFDNQRLLSTAVGHNFDSQLGTFALPGFTGGALPVLRNALGAPSSVVVLANNNEVSGFQIDGTGSLDPFDQTAVFHTGISGNGITSFNVNRNLFTNVNAGTTITHVGVGSGVFSENVLNGFGFGSSLGFSVAAAGGSSLQLVANGNTITGFRGEDTDGSGTVTAAEDTNGNNVLDPGIGINVVAAGGSVVDAQVYNNTLSNNGQGLRAASLGGSNLAMVAAGNVFSQNANGGALVEANASGAAVGFLGNQFLDNFGPGINGVATVGSVLTLTAGTTNPVSGNLFDGNTGAGIAMTLDSGSLGRLFVYNNQITNTLDDNALLTPFNGEGVYLLSTGQSALLEGVIDANLITGNEGDGIFVAADGLSSIRSLVIGNLDGDNNNGNLITNQGQFNPVTGALIDPGSGIRFVRTGNSRFDFVQVVDNEIFGNTDRGIDFFIDGGLLDIADFVVAQNNIANNLTDGVGGLIQSDGIINLDLRSNVITGNGIDGVSFQQNRFAIDNGGVTGVWAGNTITANADNGIDIGAPMLDLQVGTTDLGNLIARNGGAGVFLSGPGSASFTNNLITQNGAALNAGAAAADVNTFGAGVDIGGVGFKDLLFVNNRIVGNFGDGVEIAVGEVGFSQLFFLNFTDNIVAQNTGRGYDVLNQGSSSLDLTIRGTALGRSVIAENGREGVYVVNTSSFDQDQTGPTEVVASPSDDPTHGMSIGNSSVFAQPVISMIFDQNQVVGNGRDQTSTIGLPTDSVGGTGLVFRIGTAGGGYGPFAFGIGDDGGFASQGFAGVIASVTNNFFSGNFGADVYAESFTSTAPPATTGGTWNGTEFTLNSYDGDPLARFDLVFTGNTYESTDFNNIGAYYNNAEPNFKSRTGGRTAPDPSGPFATGNGPTRRRNAQRLAYRDETLPSSAFPGGLPENDGVIQTPGPDGIPGNADDVFIPFYDLPPQPNSPPNPFYPSIDDLFLYAGMGQSTFRISQTTLNGTNTVLNPDGTTTIVPAFAPFLLDGFPYDDVTDANGVSHNTGPFTFGELPYGWSVMN